MKTYGVKTKPTTVKKPQGNVQHKHMHLLVAELLCTQGDEIPIPKKSRAQKEVRKLL